MQKDVAPRAAVVQDLSGVGRCALGVALPVLGAMGVCACPLPTVALSTHTGGFGSPATWDLTDFMREALAHWRATGIVFDAVYSGYMADVGQVELTRALIWDQREKGAPLCVVDPAMADSGRLYAGLTQDMPAQMRALCAEADVITPNLTEASMLAGEAVSDKPRAPEDVCRLLRKLCDMGCGHALVTGVPMRSGRMANVCAQRGDAGFWLCPYKQLPGAFPGTGDLFASVLTGAMLTGERLPDAMARATGFVCRAVERTIALGTPAREGVQFERLLREIDGEQGAVSRYLCQ